MTVGVLPHELFRYVFCPNAAIIVTLNALDQCRGLTWKYLFFTWCEWIESRANKCLGIFMNTPLKVMGVIDYISTSSG